jgi:hypothetical protein
VTQGHPLNPRAAHSAPCSRSRHLLVRLGLLGALVLAAFLPAAAMAQPEPVPAPPEVVTAPLGAEEPAAVVPYADLLGAARGEALTVAVVDTANYWVAATDAQGRLVASQIPRPALGREFGVPAGTGASLSAPPTAFELTRALRAAGVTVIAPAPPSAQEGRGGGRSLTTSFLLALGFTALIVAIVLFRRRQAGGGGRSGAAGHGKLRTTALVTKPKERFEDIAGCDEAVEELREIVTFLAEPERFERVKARMPKGVILHGPPGTGKTLLAKGVAGEAGVSFFAISGSDFVDTFVGVGASRVRDLFRRAREVEGGAIIFFDERRRRPRGLRRGARGHAEPVAGGAGRFQRP